MGTDQTGQLLDRYLKGKCTASEEKQVEDWLENYQHPGSDWNRMSYQEKAKWAKDLFAGIKNSAGIYTAPVVSIHRKRKFIRIAAAAAIIILLSTGGYFFFFNKAEKLNIAALPQTERFKNDIDPANEGVVLKTNDGREIFLDSMDNGSFLAEGKIVLQKNGDAVTYTSNVQQVFYHTISTNKGKDYHLTLVDGTEVWLDAMSSIYFPTAFPGNERVVEVTGQAYFEVAKNAAKPFKVRSGDQLVEVLGTHFNINAHDANIKTTLLEGSVIVSRESGVNSRESIIITPGQQASALPNSPLGVGGADLDEVMAWKNGRFYFDGASVEDIMKQISRWYDIEVMVEDKIKEQFVAKIPRNTPVSRLLNLLEMTKQVAFTIEGKKVTVMAVKK